MTELPDMRGLTLKGAAKLIGILERNVGTEQHDGFKTLEYKPTGDTWRWSKEYVGVRYTENGQTLGKYWHFKDME